MIVGRACEKSARVKPPLLLPIISSGVLFQPAGFRVKIRDAPAVGVHVERVQGRLPGTLVSTCFKAYKNICLSIYLFIYLSKYLFLSSLSFIPTAHVKRVQE